MRKLLATTLLACGVAAVGITAAAPAHAAATCNGLTVTITGTNGNDVRVGTPGNDVFAMGAGNDVVSGLDGNDTACMGTGDDQFFGGRGEDTFVAESVADGSDVFLGDDGVNQSGAVMSLPTRLAPRRSRSAWTTARNDGQAGEGDFIAGDDVDAVQGGSGADVLTEHAVGAARSARWPRQRHVERRAPACSAKRGTTRSSISRAAGRGSCTAGTERTS